jgi:hypothetical protein
MSVQTSKSNDGTQHAKDPEGYLKGSLGGGAMIGHGKC